MTSKSTHVWTKYPQRIGSSKDKQLKKYAQSSCRTLRKEARKEFFFRGKIVSKDLRPEH